MEFPIDSIASATNFLEARLRFIKKLGSARILDKHVPLLSSTNLMNGPRGVRLSLLVSNLCNELWYPVIQFVDARILKKIFWTPALIIFCYISIPETPLFSETSHSPISILFIIWRNIPFRYHSHLSITYGPYETFFRGGKSCFLHFFWEGWKSGLFSISVISPLTELETRALCITVATELPWYCYDVLGCQDTSTLDHAYRQAFIDEYTQQYSLIPQESPSGLMNTASCIRDKAHTNIHV